MPLRDISRDVLLVEHDLPTIRLITKYLASKGCSCTSVSTGFQCLEELRRVTPKVILLDNFLPDIVGHDLCKTIKSDEKCKEIPLFYFTTVDLSKDEEKWRATGADGYILKPFSLPDLDVILDIVRKAKKK